jgi:DNA-3-methyladenine glycosylase II
MISGEIEKGIIHLNQNDPRLAAVISAAGKCTIKAHKQHFYSLIRAIIGQQLSGQAADSIIRKFFNFFNGKPDASLILQVPDDVLRSLGLSGQKIKYIRDLSEKIASGEINLKKLSTAPDDEIISELTLVKGIGIWTVQMFLIFTLFRPDVLPLNDLGIKKGIMKVYNLRSLPGEKKILAISRKNNWAPYRTLASWYLWKSLEL